MKRIMTILMAVFMFFSCESSNSKVVDFNQLPAKAQSFIRTHFSDKEITMAFCDCDIFDKDYEVRFDDGAKVDFDKDGEWTSVEVRKNDGVPVAIIPAAINSFVAEKHQNAFVVDIDKDRREYNVELNNGIDIVFDKNGNFKRYDD